MLSRVLLALAAVSVWPASAADFSAVEKHALAEIAAGTVPSLALAVTLDGEIIYERAFGLADIAAGTAATPRTAYGLASATKPITATALLVLQQQGKVDIAAPAAQYLAPLRLRAADGSAAKVTLSQLLAHTAGLGTYAHIYYGDAIPRTPSLAAAARDYGVLVQAPGRVAEYSNLGYGLAGEVIARRSGQSFGDFLAKAVFQPLQMDDSFVDTPRAGVVVATPYDVAQKPLPKFYNDTPGAGNVSASVRDLIRFARFQLDPASVTNAPLTAASVARQQRNPDPRALQHYYAGAYYGLGWYVRADDNGERVIWHEGGMPGASSIIKLLPEKKLGVAVLSNRTDANPTTQAIANELLQAVLPGYKPLPLDPVANYVPYASQEGFRGRWAGSIRVGAAQLQCSLEFATDGKIHFRHQSLPRGKVLHTAELGGIVYGDSFISAVPQGPLQLPGMASDPAQMLLLKLVRDGDRLRGGAVAYASPQRLDYLLPFALELQRVADQP